MRLRLTALLLSLFAVSCGSSDDSSGPAIHPAKLYSGYDDGSTTYQVPAAVIGSSSKSVKWSVVDGSIASVDPDKTNPRYAIVTTKMAGKTTLKATVDGQTFSVPLTVTQYPPGAQELGNELYQIDKSSQSTGGTPEDVKGLGCIGCHGIGGVNHSPSKLGGFDDAALLKTIATGVTPTGDMANNGNHKFTLDETQQTAILSRLRSLTPIDWPQ